MGLLLNKQIPCLSTRQQSLYFAGLLTKIVHDVSPVFDEYRKTCHTVFSLPRTGPNF